MMVLLMMKDEECRCYMVVGVGCTRVQEYKSTKRSSDEAGDHAITVTLACLIAAIFRSYPGQIFDRAGNAKIIV